jgi:hypothetical protein
MKVANLAESLAVIGARALKEGYNAAAIVLVEDGPDRSSLMTVSVDLQRISEVSGYLTMAQGQVLDGEYPPVKTS